MANINELIQGWGFKKQADIGTANVLAGIWRHTNLNTKPWAKVPGERGRPGRDRQGARVPDAAFQVALQHADPRDLEVRIVGVPGMGDGVLAGQRRSDGHAGRTLTSSRPALGSYESHRPGTAVLLVRPADPPRRLGDPRRDPGRLRGQGMEAVHQELARPRQRHVLGRVRGDRASTRRPAASRCPPPPCRTSSTPA